MHRNIYFKKVEISTFYPSRELYSMSKISETKKEEFHTDLIDVMLLPGRVYEIVVYSVNGECKTDSDPQEIFINPGK